MQYDGNLVVYRSNNTASWASNTYRSGAAFVQVQDDGRLVLHRGDGSIVWQTGTQVHLGSISWFGSYQLKPGQQLNADQYLANDRYRLVLQQDANLILYGPGFHVLWQSGAAGSPSAYCGRVADARLVMGVDGHVEIRAKVEMEVYDEYLQTVVCQWGPDTGWVVSGPGAGALVLQGDGNLVSYNGAGTALWSTGTGGMI
jgi:hypothetical protein